MKRSGVLCLTALAPAVWGSTYLVTTEMLPAGYPMTVAMLRALPAGLLLMLFIRQLPKGIWWGRRWSGLCLWGGDFVWGFLLFVLSFQQSVHSMIPPSHFNIRFLSAEIVSAVWQYCRDFYFNDKLRTGDNPCLRPASRHKPNSGCCLE